MKELKLLVKYEAALVVNFMILVLLNHYLNIGMSQEIILIWSFAWLYIWIEAHKSNKVEEL